jgi:hypothetical protein
VDFNIPKGAKIYLGAPAKPLDDELVLRIAELAASFPTVVEAHLPQCWVENVMPNAAQILVLVLATDEGAPELANAVGEGISGLLPSGAHMDVWKLSVDHELMPAVRKAGCGILGPDRKPIKTSSLKRLLKRFKVISR